MERTTPLSYQAQLQKGIVKVHADQMRKADNIKESKTEIPISVNMDEEESSIQRNTTTQTLIEENKDCSSGIQMSDKEGVDATVMQQSVPVNTTESNILIVRRSGRIIKKPNRLNLYTVLENGELILSYRLF